MMFRQVNKKPTFEHEKLEDLMQLPFAQDADPRPDIVIQELSPMTLAEG